MQALLLLGAAIWLMGGKSNTQTPPPQQTVTPPTPPGQSTGQIVADVLQTGLDLFKQFMNSNSGK